jgi:hypothetical protein
MTLRTAAVITLAIILAVALAELSCVADEMVSPAGQVAGTTDVSASPAGAGDLDHVGGIATPALVPGAS